MADGESRHRARRPRDDPGAVPTWEDVARRHGRFVYSVAYRLTGNHEEAQDLVQEVLVRVQRGLRTYEPGSLEGWLARITTNAFLDEMRRRKRRPTEPLPEHDPERLLPLSPEPAEELAGARLDEEIQAALARVSPEFRVVLVLSDVVGHSYAEIADELGVPIGTVRSRLHRGRAALREALDV